MTFPGVASLSDALPGRYLVEEKLDGYRLLLRRGAAFLRGGKASIWSKLPLRIRKLAIDEPVYGELHVAGGPASDVAAALAGETKSRARLRFVGFYLPHRRLYPGDHRATLRANGVPVPRLGARRPVRIDKRRTRSLLAEAKRRGIEGWVLKLDALDPAWGKLKVERTADCIVTGIKPGQGKYSGMAGALAVSVYRAGELVEIASISGMDDATRRKISRRDLGRAVEVRYQDVAARGRLRHPRFMRWREDKESAECTDRQLPRRPAG